MKPDKQTYLACGGFDAVHIGHRKVISKLVKKSKVDNAKSVVILLVNKNSSSRTLVYSYEERKYALKKMGVDEVEFYEYDVLNPDLLVEGIFIEKYHTSIYFTGDFDDDTIAKACLNKSIFVERVSPKLHNDIPVSTEMVVCAIRDDDFNLIQRLMGHNYIFIGEIMHGKGEGRKYGLPTANLDFVKTKILPPHGVYATTSIIQGEKFSGYTNIGLRPSVDKMTYVSVETFLLDFDRDIYGQRVVLEIVYYVRPVMKFSGGLAEVKKQVEKDIQAVQKVFS